MRDCFGGDGVSAAWVRDTSPLLVIGASARAAVQSAYRSGWRSLIAVDLFRDCDWPPECRGLQVRALDRRLAALPSVRSARCWMYTGAMENRPQVVAQISRRVTLLGNPPRVLRRIRDPQRLAAVLQAAGLPFAEALARPDARLSQGLWLRKPRASNAGRGICRFEAPSPGGALGTWIYQRFVPGQACGGVFLAAAGSARLLGVTRQLIGDDCACFGARGFQYAGSIGPLPLTGDQERQWQQIGECLSVEFRLRGLFGVDAIEAGERIVPVEVNPRYTASVEVLERSLRWPMMAWHVQACGAGRLPSWGSLPVSVACSGKAILYAVESCRWAGEFEVSQGGPDLSEAWPTLADIPRHDTCFKAGEPVLTVLAQDADPVRVFAQLRERAAEVRARYLVSRGDMRVASRRPT